MKGPSRRFRDIQNIPQSVAYKIGRKVYPLMAKPSGYLTLWCPLEAFEEIINHPQVIAAAKEQDNDH